MEKTNQRKALIISLIFGLAGIIALAFMVSDWVLSLPLVIFYFTLVINTYFSIKLFSAITPTSRTQNSIDVTLFILYLILAFSLGNPLYFILCNLFLFIVAAIKYSFLLNTIPHGALLKKKILVDLSGVLGTAIIFTGMLFGYLIFSLWLFALGFVAANLLLFFVWPLYRLD